MPSAPGRPAAIRFPQAPTASIPPGEMGSSGVAVPSQGRKFHCFVTQPPGGPADRQVDGPGVVGKVDRGRLGRRGGGDVVGRGVVDRGSLPQGRRRRPHADVAAGSPTARAVRCAGELDHELAAGRTRGRARGRLRRSRAGGCRSRASASRVAAAAIGRSRLILFCARGIPCIRASSPLTPARRRSCWWHILPDAMESRGIDRRAASG